MKTVSQEEILHGDIKKSILKMAIPLMLMSLVNTLYGIADTFFVGQLGELQVGAVGLVHPIMNCGFAFAVGLSAAAIAMVSRSLGAGDKEKANEVATHLFVIAGIIGALFGVFLLVFADPILRMLQAPADIYADSKAYLIGVSLEFLFMIIAFLFHSLRQSTGDSQTGVKLNTIACVINIILDPIFIFGLKWGTFGAAFATTLSKACMVPFIIYVLIKDKETIHISLKKYKMKLSVVIEILKIGIPAAAGQFLTAFGFIMMNVNIIAYGSVAMSAYNIGSSLSNIFYIPVNIFGMSLPAFVGQNLGAKNPERAKECFKVAMKLMFSIALVVVIIGFLTISQLVRLFIPDASPTLMAIATEYGRYCVGTAIFMGWFNCLTGVFDGSGNTKLSLILSTFRLWGLRIPMIYMFSTFTDFGPTGIWLSMVLSNMITCLVGQVVYQRYPWQKRGSLAVKS